MDTYKCSNCQEHKPITDFYIQKSGKPYSYCKACKVQMERHRRRPKVTEKPQKKPRKEKFCPQCKQWLPLSSFSRRARHDGSPNGISSWCKTCNGKESLSHHYTRKANGGHHTHEEWETLKAKYNFTCLACKKREPEISLTRDHVLPIAMGGTNDIGNVQPLCNSCNCRKRKRFIDYR